MKQLTDRQKNKIIGEIAREIRNSDGSVDATFELEEGLYCSIELTFHRDVFKSLFRGSYDCPPDPNTVRYHIRFGDLHLYDDDFYVVESDIDEWEILEGLYEVLDN